MAEAETQGITAQTNSSDALYTCEQCGGVFPADGVWNASGKIVCKECYTKYTPPGAAGSAQVAPSANKKSHDSFIGPVLPRITCPHCWQRFTADQILWISQHAELRGDVVLGPDAASRFLPSRFTVEGDALDARGMKCQLLACPHCHLVLPRPLVDSEPLFISIVGVPASGKSYFLTAMTWELRRLLSEQFAITFNDTDTVTNRIVNEYEEHLFLQGDRSRVVAIRKTEVHGVALYDQIRLGQQVVNLPRPFLFSLRPSAGHPNTAQRGKFSRILCLYDNAGEAFDPGEDTTSSPVTQHLAKSRVLMFLYDPIQDARFREKCKAISKDPQLEGRSRRQETVLLEMTGRIRRYTGLSIHQKHNRPLIVVVPKADVWGPLIDLDINTEPVLPHAVNGGTLSGVDITRIQSTSARVRALLADIAPEFVAAVEDFSDYIIYIPVSALGRSPAPMEGEAGQGGLYVPAGDIKPKWVTAPILYAFAQWASGLIWSGPEADEGNAAAQAG